MNARRILFATDFSESSDGAAQYAVSLACEAGASLYVVHVVEPPAYGPSDPGGLIDQNASLLKQMLDEIIPDDVELPHESHTLVGDPATEIVRYADEEHVELIVIGTHGRAGPTRVLMGSVAESVMRRSSCPVLTIKQPANVTAGEPLDC